MKEFKFTPENLKRHLNAYPWTMYRADNSKYIYTTRDKIKGDVGDVFNIGGVGKFVLIERKCIEEHNPWEEEGFSSKEEYDKEIERIYGANSIRVLHILLKLNEETELKDILKTLGKECRDLWDCDICSIRNTCRGYLHNHCLSEFCVQSIDEINVRDSEQ